LSLCIAAGAKVTVLALSAFTLSWSHSVQKTRWEEDWRITPSGLEIVEARIRGSGAGMDPPEGARLEGGWWRYEPKVPPQSELVLGASAATGSGWRICGGGKCLDLDDAQAAGRPFILRACRETPSPREGGGD
jgi:hypothetical protein